MDKMALMETIRQKYDAVRGVLHEHGRRIRAASEARQIGWGVSVWSKKPSESRTRPFDACWGKSNRGKSNIFTQKRSRLQ